MERRVASLETGTAKILEIVTRLDRDHEDEDIARHARERLLAEQREEKERRARERRDFMGQIVTAIAILSAGGGACWWVIKTFLDVYLGRT
jgi:hypothetical protein